MCTFEYKLKQHYFKNAKPYSYYNIGNIYLNILCILEYNSNNAAPSIGTIGKRSRIYKCHFTSGRWDSDRIPFSIQSCRSCYATQHLCQRSFYKIFVKFRNSKKNILKIVLIIVNINRSESHRPDVKWHLYILPGDFLCGPKLITQLGTLLS
jgi:hypothetical protein